MVKGGALHEELQHARHSEDTVSERQRAYGTR